MKDTLLEIEEEPLWTKTGQLGMEQVSTQRSSSDQFQAEYGGQMHILSWEDYHALLCGQYDSN